jgi:hypothetical protein
MLYTQYYAADANFRLKNVSRSGADAPLGNRWGYFVPDEPYQQYLGRFKDQHEVSWIKLGFSGRLTMSCRHQHAAAYLRLTMPTRSDLEESESLALARLSVAATVFSFQMA